MEQEIAAYYFALYSLWFFSFFLLVRLLFIFYWKKIYWLDLLLLPPLWFSIFYLIVRNDFAGFNFKVGKILLYSSFVSLGLWLIVWLAVWLEKGEK